MNQINPSCRITATPSADESAKPASLATIDFHGKRVQLNRLFKGQSIMKGGRHRSLGRCFFGRCLVGPCLIGPCLFRYGRFPIAGPASWVEQRIQLGWRNRHGAAGRDRLRGVEIEPIRDSDRIQHIRRADWRCQQRRAEPQGDAREYAETEHFCLAPSPQRCRRCFKKDSGPDLTGRRRRFDATV